MQVELKRFKGSDMGEAIITRQPGDKKIYNESLFLYKVQQCLIEQGYDVIKKRMWKDGHLMGDEETQYIRSRNKKCNPSFCLYDADWMIRKNYEDYNDTGTGKLKAMFDIWKEN